MTHFFTDFSSSRAGGLQPTFEELSQNTRLLIELRWVAGCGILLCTVIARYLMSIDVDTIALFTVGVAVLGYNSLLFKLRKTAAHSLLGLQRLTWGQIVLDWLAMIALLHFTGGITSPALIYFVIHVALSGTTLQPWQTRSLAILAIVIVSALAWLEGTGALPHVTISDLGLSDNAHRNTTYVAAVMVFFGSTVSALSELVTRNAQRLRVREKQVQDLFHARTTFVRVATHELRAPLGASLSLMRNIEQGYAGELNLQQAAILKRVTNRLEGLRALIDDLLTLATSREATIAQVPLRPESLRAALDRIIEQERPNAENKQIHLECDLAKEPGMIVTSEVGLGIIVGNLLNNAIKYTPDGGTVRVAYKLDDERACVVVADTGIGIPSSEMKNLFSEFFRASNAKQLQVMGTGIGLTTVRTLVERYNGTIDLESEEGKGTTVTVTLPLASDQPKSGDWLASNAS